MERSMVYFDYKNMEVGEIWIKKNQGKGISKNNIEVFAKIPYGVLQASNKFNQYILPTYLYLAINRNVFGEIKTSVRSIREEYINTTNRRYWHEEDFYKSILMLTASIVDEENNSICDNLIDIKGLEDLSQMELRYNSDSQIDTLIKDFEKNEADNIPDLKKKDFIIIMNQSPSQKGFVKCTYDEYNAFKSFSNYLKTNDSRISVCQALNAYFSIKYIIKRNEALIEMGIGKKNSLKQVSRILLKKECGFSDYTAKAVLQVLNNMGLVYTIPNPKPNKENDYFIKLKENESENNK